MDDEECYTVPFIVVIVGFFALMIGGLVNVTWFYEEKSCSMQVLEK